jgi:hypothetical protein
MLNTDQEAIERKAEMMNKNPNIFSKAKGCAKKKTKQETHPAQMSLFAKLSSELHHSSNISNLLTLQGEY